MVLVLFHLHYFLVKIFLPYRVIMQIFQSVFRARRKKFRINIFDSKYYISTCHSVKLPCFALKLSNLNVKNEKQFIVLGIKDYCETL